MSGIPWTWSGNRQRIQDRFYDVLRGDILGFRLVRHRHSMPQNIHRDRLDILRYDEMPSVQERHGSSGEGESNRRPWRSAVLDVAIQVKGCGRRRTRRVYQVDDVVS